MKIISPFFLLLLVLIFSSCQENLSPSCDKECSYGSVCTTNQCDCQLDSVTVKVGDDCLNLNGLTHFTGYYATNGNRDADTFAIFIPKRDSMKYGESYNLGAIPNKKLPKTGGIHIVHRYHQPDALDSIVFLTAFANLQDKLVTAVFNGKFSDYNTLKGELKWQEKGVNIDSCQMTFKHNPKI